MEDQDVRHTIAQLQNDLRSAENTIQTLDRALNRERRNIQTLVEEITKLRKEKKGGSNEYDKP